MNNNELAQQVNDLRKRVEELEEIVEILQEGRIIKLRRDTNPFGFDGQVDV